MELSVKKFGDEVPAKPRAFLKALVDVLDLAQQNSDFRPGESTNLSRIVDEAASVEEHDASLDDADEVA